MALPPGQHAVPPLRRLLPLICRARPRPRRAHLCPPAPARPQVLVTHGGLFSSAEPPSLDDLRSIDRDRWG